MPRSSSRIRSLAQKKDLEEELERQRKEAEKEEQKKKEEQKRKERARKQAATKVVFGSQAQQQQRKVSSEWAHHDLRSGVDGMRMDHSPFKFQPRTSTRTSTSTSTSTSTRSNSTGDDESSLGMETHGFPPNLFTNANYKNGVCLPDPNTPQTSTFGDTVEAIARAKATAKRTYFNYAPDAYYHHMEARLQSLRGSPDAASSTEIKQEMKSTVAFAQKRHLLPDQAVMWCQPFASNAAASCASLPTTGDQWFPFTLYRCMGVISGRTLTTTIEPKPPKASNPSKPPKTIHQATATATGTGSTRPAKSNVMLTLTHKLSADTTSSSSSSNKNKNNNGKRKLEETTAAGPPRSQQRRFVMPPPPHRVHHVQVPARCSNEQGGKGRDSTAAPRYYGNCSKQKAKAGAKMEWEQGYWRMRDSTQREMPRANSDLHDDFVEQRAEAIQAWWKRILHTTSKQVSSSTTSPQTAKAANPLLRPWDKRGNLLKYVLNDASYVPPSVLLRWMTQYNKQVQDSHENMILRFCDNGRTEVVSSDQKVQDPLSGKDDKSEQHNSISLSTEDLLRSILDLSDPTTLWKTPLVLAIPRVACRTSRDNGGGSKASSSSLAKRQKTGATTGASGARRARASTLVYEVTIGLYMHRMLPEALLSQNLQRVLACIDRSSVKIVRPLAKADTPEQPYEPTFASASFPKLYFPTGDEDEAVQDDWRSNAAQILGQAPTASRRITDTEYESASGSTTSSSSDDSFENQDFYWCEYDSDSDDGDGGESDGEEDPMSVLMRRRDRFKERIRREKALEKLNRKSSARGVEDRKVTAIIKDATMAAESTRDETLLSVFSTKGLLKMWENPGVYQHTMSKYWPIIQEALEAPVDDDPSGQPVFLLDLLLHQQQGTAWMLEQEDPATSASGLNSLFWEEREFVDGGKYYVAPELGQIRMQPPHTTRGGLLCDEMGLGKTIQVLALISATLRGLKHQTEAERSRQSEQHQLDLTRDMRYMDYKKGKQIPLHVVWHTTLIIVPPALLPQWKSEIVKCTGSSLLVCSVTSNGRSSRNKRKTTRQGSNVAYSWSRGEELLPTMNESFNPDRPAELPPSCVPDIILTTYCVQKQVGVPSFLRSIRWGRIVLDEMQEIRSPTTQIAAECVNLVSDRRWMLSGTPLFENGIDDLKGELNFLQLEPFSADSEDGFFNFMIRDPWKANDPRAMHVLRMLKRVLLRRSKTMTVCATGLPLLALPPLTVEYVKVPQRQSERALYCFMERVVGNFIRAEDDQKKGNHQSSPAGETSLSTYKRLCLRLLRELCTSAVFLNGGLGVKTQLLEFNRLLLRERRIQSYSDVHCREQHQSALSPDDAILHLATFQEASKTGSKDEVSDLLLGHGTGTSRRVRALDLDAMTQKSKEQLEVLSSELVVVKQSKRKALWRYAMEMVTMGQLPIGEYANVKQGVRSLWMWRKATRNMDLSTKTVAVSAQHLGNVGGSTSDNDGGNRSSNEGQDNGSVKVAHARGHSAAAAIVIDNDSERNSASGGSTNGDGDDSDKDKNYIVHSTTNDNHLDDRKPPASNRLMHEASGTRHRGVAVEGSDAMARLSPPSRLPEFLRCGWKPGIGLRAHLYENSKYPWAAPTCCLLQRIPQAVTDKELRTALKPFCGRGQYSLHLFNDEPSRSTSYKLPPTKCAWIVLNDASMLMGAAQRTHGIPVATKNGIEYYSDRMKDAKRAYATAQAAYSLNQFDEARVEMRNAKHWYESLLKMKLSIVSSDHKFSKDGIVVSVASLVEVGTPTAAVASARIGDLDLDEGTHEGDSESEGAGEGAGAHAGALTSSDSEYGCDKLKSRLQSWKMQLSALPDMITQEECKLKRLKMGMKDVDSIKTSSTFEQLLALGSGNQKLTQCAICLGYLGETSYGASRKFKDGTVMMTRCGHLYCAGCLSKYIGYDQHSLCPTCRKPIGIVEDCNIVDPALKGEIERAQDRHGLARDFVLEVAQRIKESNGSLDPNTWNQLYHSIPLPKNVDATKHARATAIPRDVCGHLRACTGMDLLRGADDCPRRLDRDSLCISSKVRQLLIDLPRNERSVVFSSESTTLSHLGFILRRFGIGYSSLHKGQKPQLSQQALAKWLANETNDGSGGGSGSDGNDVDPDVMIIDDPTGVGANANASTNSTSPPPPPRTTATTTPIPCPVLLVQGGAAACGLTLTEASKMFIMEPFLRYEEEKQAYARLHRYGQTRKVHCRCYYAPVSVENRLLEWRRLSESTPMPKHSPTLDAKVVFSESRMQVDDDDSDTSGDDDEKDASNDGEGKEEDADQIRFLLRGDR